MSKKIVVGAKGKKAKVEGKTTTEQVTEQVVESPVEPAQEADTPLTVQERTAKLVRMNVGIDTLVPNDLNPNQMNDAEFNMLYDNIERMGVTDPILVRTHPTQDGKYRIVGGYHRWEVAKLHGLDTVPVTIIDDPEFDEDMEKFQLVRHNIIHGSMSPQRFMKLFESLSKKYSDDVASEMFGFTDEEEFRKLVQLTAKGLPKEMQQQFKDAASEIKTIDDLTQVLNRLFTAYGDTVPYNYMIFDYGKQDHIWLRMKSSQRKDFEGLANVCKVHSVTMDAVLTMLLQLTAQGALSMHEFNARLAKLPTITIPDNVELPTEEALAGV